ncbi:MAG: hypothetical protein KF718_33565 [Polyangiaceae bacterium]|nr:hypothetical protein [Polyangiaceae bacterium]
MSRPVRARDFDTSGDLVLRAIVRGRPRSSRGAGTEIVECASTDELLYVLRWRPAVAIVAAGCDDETRSQLEALSAHVSVTFAPRASVDETSALLAESMSVHPRAPAHFLSPPTWEGLAGAVFSLGGLRVDRACRVAWLFGRHVDLTDTLFDGLLALCDQWTVSPEALLPVDTVIELSSGERHVFGYDDAKRLRGEFGCKQLIRTSARRGYALRKLETPPAAARKSESGLRRATRLRQR